MFGIISNVMNDGAENLRRRIISIYTLLVGANVVIWGWAFAALHDSPILLGTALLAYAFGLRHAVDADHIAAIDNVTRKLMQEGKRPVTVGFFFAMGHASVVILAAAGIALTAAALHVDHAKSVGGIISTSVSALFLFAIAVMNLLIFFSVWKTF